MNREQVKSELLKNPEFSLKFLVDNNPTGVYSALTKEGFLISTPQAAYAALFSLLKSNKKRLYNIVKDIPYIDTASNYTGGYRDFFMLNTPADLQTPQMRGMTPFSWTGLFAGIGAGLLAYGQTATTAGGNIQATETEIERIEREKKEAEAKKKKQMYWIIGIVIGVMVYKNNKKKKEEGLNSVNKPASKASDPTLEVVKDTAAVVDAANSVATVRKFSAAS